MPKRIAHTDGASRGNPGHAAFGVRICDAEGNEVDRVSAYLGRQTNNYAEYRGLIAALRWAVDHDVDDLEVRSDSQLLVRQMNGRYRVKSPGLRPLYEEARALADRIARFRIEHVRREDNVDADSLANEVLDERLAEG